MVTSEHLGFQAQFKNCFYFIENSDFVWNVVTAMKLFIRLYFRLQTHLQLITKKLKGNFMCTINLKNSILTLKHSILT